MSSVLFNNTVISPPDLANVSQVAKPALDFRGEIGGVGCETTYELRPPCISIID